jgi:hypothetical protein
MSVINDNYFKLIALYILQNKSVIDKPLDNELELSSNSDFGYKLKALYAQNKALIDILFADKINLYRRLGIGPKLN